MLMRAALPVGDAADRAVGASFAAPSLLGRAAIGALHDELSLAPKPGLVSPNDRGSHRDMTAATFFRSLFALRGYFVEIATAGAQRVPFVDLETLGVAAERRMLAATGGVNTHRGAVFSLGLLCAAAGAAAVDESAAIRAALRRHWGRALRDRAAAVPTSRAACLARTHGLRSAGDEAALGLPTLFDHAWPAMQAARRAGLDDRRCRLHALFASMAVLDDTNLVQRGGIEGLRFGQASARRWLADGGAFHPAAIARASAIRDAFVGRHLSPGGSADVLAAACWLHRITSLR